MTDEEAEMLGYGAVFAAEDEETPLYTHAQLVEERRRAWNEAIELLRRADDQLTQLHGYCYLSSRSWPCVPADEIRATINAIRDLTKDITHD